MSKIYRITVFEQSSVKNLFLMFFQLMFFFIDQLKKIIVMSQFIKNTY